MACWIWGLGGKLMRLLDLMFVYFYVSLFSCFKSFLHSQLSAPLTPACPFPTLCTFDLTVVRTVALKHRLFKAVAKCFFVCPKYPIVSHQTSAVEPFLNAFQFLSTLAFKWVLVLKKLKQCSDKSKARADQQHRPVAQPYLFSVFSFKLM